MSFNSKTPEDPNSAANCTYRAIKYSRKDYTGSGRFDGHAPGSMSQDEAVSLSGMSPRAVEDMA